MKVDFSMETLFSFPPPNLCLLGNQSDFQLLAKEILSLTSIENVTLDLLALPFIESVGLETSITFQSKSGSRSLAMLINGSIVFQLDPKVWERLFKYFVLLSWKKSTYYLNESEECLSDLKLLQDCNFICSSAF